MASSVTFNLRTGEVHTMLHSVGGEVGQEVIRRGHLVFLRARSLAPVKTGQLRSSIYERVSPGAEVSVEIGATAPYAMFVHEGTGPHRIQGRPFLSFFWPKAGKRVVFRWVNHPGTAPNPFLLNALSAAEG